MALSNGKSRPTPGYAPAHFYTEQVMESENSGGDSDVNISYDSATSSTDSDSCCSNISEEEEWEQEVSPKGELFFVRSHPDKSEKNENLRDAVSSEKLSAMVSSLNVEEAPEAHGRHQGRAAGKERDSQVFLKKVKTITSIQAEQSKVSVGLTKEVIVAMNPRQPNFGRRSTPLEALIGIIATRGSHKDNGEEVIIQALVPGSEAIENQDIHIGDRIVKINDAEVTWANLDQVLTAVASSLVSQYQEDRQCSVHSDVMVSHSHQIKLTIRKRPNPNDNSQPQTSSKIPDASIIKSELLIPKLLSGTDEKWLKITTDLMSVPHVILYLTLGTSETAEPKEDILYQFPGLSNKLVEIRATLITLSDMLQDMVESQPTSSSVVIGSHVVHIGYAREGKEVMLLALPAKCITSYQISHLTSEVAHVLKFQYGSLHNAFTDESNRLSIDHLFSLTFVNHLSVGNSPSIQAKANQRSAYGAKYFNAPQQVPIASDLQTCIDELLNEFEAADFADMSEDHFDMQRLYNIMGTCLFYKGYLVANHLPKNDLADIFLYLHYMGLLETSVRNLVMHAVIWREVFPYKPHEKVTLQTRWFLLVVGQNHTLLGVLLEAGGCAFKATNPRGPDAFYVDQAQTTLLQLDVQQVSKSLDALFESSPIPSLASPDSFFGQTKKGKIEMFTSRSVDSLNQTIKKGLNSSKLSLGAVSNQPSSHTDITNLYSKKEQQTQGETDSDSTSLSLTPSGTSDDTTPILGRRGRNSSQRHSWSDVDSQDENDQCQIKSNSHQRYLPSLVDLTVMGESLPTFTRDSGISEQKLTSGPHNVLFHYLQLNYADGVFIAPTHFINNKMGPLYSEIMSNFKASTQIIHKTIQQTSRNDTNYSRAARHPTPFIEQGMLFKCQASPKQDASTKESEILFYWVVGRMFIKPYQREVYVCYHDSCPQSIVEMAFQLSFGLWF